MSLQPSQSEPRLIRLVRRFQKRFGNLDSSQLREQSLKLRYDVLCGRSLESLIGPAFGLAIEASRRTTGLVPYDVQIRGGIELARLRIAEMKTGEGKTLTATMPMYLFALAGKGAHLATVNDYLAERDANQMEPLYRMLGLSVGVVKGGDKPTQRRVAYRKDITYGTAKEFGFDFLRDRITVRSRGIAGAATRSIQEDPNLLHRPFHFALVDEADSILIDEARTPLVIAMVNQSDQQKEKECLLWAARHATSFQEGRDYKYEQDKRKVKLMSAGLTRLRGLPQNAETTRVSVHQLYRYMENAIKVNRDFHLDQTYAITNDEVQIIDEFTGRIADGRQWQDGIHQAVQAKEAVPITPENHQTASVTIQSLFRLYPSFAGMTGTASTSRREFRRVYRKSVARIPTHRPINRTALPVRVLPNAFARWEAVVSETKSMIENNRSVLIGTRTIEKSEQLSALLTEAAVAHQVLNARYHDREAEIVAEAGQPARVTVATNMAGRGTDIKLDEQVRKAGGLHVILTEIHEAARIDWQMIGRGCRQGDLGSYRFFVSLDDEILKMGLGPERHQRIKKKYGARTHLQRNVFQLFRLAQARLERKHLVDRMILLRSDKDRHQQYYEMGLDPFLYATSSSR